MSISRQSPYPTRRAGLPAALAALALLLATSLPASATSLPAPPVPPGANGTITSCTGASCGPAHGPANDLWDGVSMLSSRQGSTICPAGWDVWRFYGSTASPGVVSAWTASRIAVTDTNNCNPNTTPTRGVSLVPNPMDAGVKVPTLDPAAIEHPTVTLAQLAARLGPLGSIATAVGPEYPAISPDICTATSAKPTTWGLPVYRMNYGAGTRYACSPATISGQSNYTSGVPFASSSSSCASLQVADQSSVKQIFNEMWQHFANPNGAIQPSQADYQWAMDYFTSPSASDPGYTWWLTNASSPVRGNFAFADLMMNINPAVTNASLPVIGAPRTLTQAQQSALWAATWKTIYQNYNLSVPACSSIYQLLPQATPANPAPATPLVGECIMPIAVAAQKWQVTTVSPNGNSKSGDILTVHTTNGGPRYAPKALSGLPAGYTSPDAAALATYKAIIKKEVASRSTKSPYWVDAPYRFLNGSYVATSAPASSHAGAEAAAASALCVPGVAAVVAPSPTTSGASLTLTLSPQVFQAEGTVAPGTIAVGIGSFTCAGCSPNGAPAVTAPSTVTVTMSVTGTKDYSAFRLYDNATAVRPACSATGECTFSFAASTTLAHQFIFYNATSPTQVVHVQVLSASATYDAVTSATCTDGTRMIDGEPVFGCWYPTQRLAVQSVTLPAAVDDTVVSSTVVPGQ
jgi:hypothetical protein